jgi:AhpD family alkylhydroperoxidase
MEFAQRVLHEGARPASINASIAVTAAHFTQCMWCIEEHVKRAKALGAADEEIAEAVFVAMALRAGGAFAHACIGMAVLEEHKDGAEPAKGVGG